MASKNTNLHQAKGAILNYYVEEHSLKKIRKLNMQDKEVYVLIAKRNMNL